MQQAAQPHRSLGRQLPLASLFFLLAAACGWWSMHYALGPSGFSVLWIPNGLLFGVLLTAPRQHWPSFLICAFFAILAANTQRNGLGWLSLILSSINIFEAWLAAHLLLSRVTGVDQIASIKRTLVIGSITILISCLVSALFATTAYQLLQLQPQHFFALYETWLASHALGMMIFGTLTVLVRIEGWRILGAPKRRIELIATLAFITMTTWLIFSRDKLPAAFIFILIPLLLICVLRHRFSGFVPAMALIAITTTMATTAGSGPFITTPGTGNSVRVLQLFLFTCCWSAVPVASVLTQYKILSRNLLRSEALYKMLTEHSRDLILRIRSNRSLDYISPSITELLGWAPEEFEHTRWALLHPDDVAILRDAISPLYEQECAGSAVYRCQHKQGHYIWLAANMRSVRNENNELILICSARDITSRIEAEQALEQQARRDPLTGLANRLLFEERMTLALARAKRNRVSVGLLYCDVDFFKSINDSYGHAAGDYALQIFAQRMRQCTRAVDLDVRLGGDEFAILVEDITSSHNLEVIAQKLITSMAEPVTFNETSFNISTSIGIGRSAIGSTDAELLLQLADEALYQAKAAGRGTWRLAETAQS